MEEILVLLNTSRHCDLQHSYWPKWNITIKKLSEQPYGRTLLSKDDIDWERRGTMARPGIPAEARDHGEMHFQRDSLLLKEIYGII